MEAAESHVSSQIESAMPVRPKWRDTLDKFLKQSESMELVHSTIYAKMRPELMVQNFMMPVAVEEFSYEKGGEDDQGGEEEEEDEDEEGGQNDEAVETEEHPRPVHDEPAHKKARLLEDGTSALEETGS